MGCLNVFLSAWLTGWTIGCVALIHGYFNGGKMEGGDPIPLWFVMAFVIPWFIVAYLLLYSNFAGKTFRLSPDRLDIETKLLFLRWRITLPRDTISEINQTKDGGEGDDSFPSWGLQVKSAAESSTLIERMTLINNFGRKHRYRTVLARLPYDHSEWLANVLGNWVGITPKLCAKEEAEHLKD
jgi:hypothetical protein